MPEEARPAQLKEWFNAARYQAIALMTQSLEPRFDLERFLKLTLNGLADRSLMQRMQQTSIALEASLPGNYRSQIEVLKALAPKLGHDFIGLFLSDFVARFGLGDIEHSLELLRYFTCFGSAEFAVRPFLVHAFEMTHRAMLRWSTDDNEHVRRLASEGIRPRLPWGMRLHALVTDPSPIAPILEALKNDPSLYVRKSAANNLNDIAKDHSGWVLSLVKTWDLKQPNIAWVVKRGCRTLIKQGHSDALGLFGFGQQAEVVASLTCAPASLQLGSKLRLSAEITSLSFTPQALAIDYVVGYVNSKGGLTQKIFKWCELELPAKATQQLLKNQLIKDFTTRKHHAGLHSVELQINGQRVAQAEFELIK
jgi:3-methyladenine DNA glycosylase AlkC